MNGIKLVLCESTDKGRLLYQHDNETEDRILYLRSPAFNRAVYQIQTNEPIIFSLNEDRILGKIISILPRNTWKKVSSIKRPQPSRFVDVQFSKRTVHHTSFNIYAQVITDLDYSCAHVVLGAIQSDTFWVALSDQCFVEILGDTLKGFFVVLEK